MDFETSQYINKYSTKAVQDFLRPQTSLDRMYLLTLVFWFCSSLFIQQEPLFRIISFSGMALFLVLSNLDKRVSRRNLTLMGSTIKLFIIYFLISFFTGNKAIDFPFRLPENLTYLDIENIVIIGFFISAIILNSFKFNLIKYYGIEGYQAFFSSFIRGLWLVGVGLFFLISLGLIKADLASLFIWEDYLLVTMILYLASSLIPYSYNPITNSILKRNSFLSLRDTTLGASLTLIILNLISNKLTFEIWKNILPLFLIVSIILFIFGMEKTSDDNSFLSKLSIRTKEMAKKISKLEFTEPEEVFVFDRSFDIIKKHNSKLRAESNSMIIPLSFTDDSVAIEAIGDLILETKDSIGRIKSETVERLTLMLSKAEWNKISKKLRTEKLTNVKLSKYLPDYNSNKGMIESLKGSLSKYKNWSQIENITSIESKLKAIEGKYNIKTFDNTKEFNFPGIKVIEKPDSFLFKFGSIQAIDVKKQVLGSKKEAKYFALKMPFVSSVDISLDDKYFMLELPFVSALETPKGTIMKFFGFEHTDGNKQEILEDLDRMLSVQAKFANYYQLQMSNMFITDKNPKFVLIQNRNEDESKLLISGSNDSFYINKKQDYPLFYQLEEGSEKKSELDEKVDVIDISEDKYEILEEETNEEKENFELKNLREIKLKNLINRLDKMNKNEFIDYMDFQSTKEFLDWIISLPDELKIRVEGESIFFK